MSRKTLSRWRQRPRSLQLTSLVPGTERDVSRTDRNNTFFSGSDNPGLTLLHDVLMTYCMFNFDLGGFLGPPEPGIHRPVDVLSLLFVSVSQVTSRA